MASSIALLMKAVALSPMLSACSLMMDRFSGVTRTFISTNRSLYFLFAIRTAQGTGGGISIMDGYRMDRTILTSKDMAHDLWSKGGGIRACRSAGHYLQEC